MAQLNQDTEYMAAGEPVVSTLIDDVMRPYGHRDLFGSPTTSRRSFVHA